MVSRPNFHCAISTSRLMPMILRLPPITAEEKGDDLVKARLTVIQVRTGADQATTFAFQHNPQPNGNSLLVIFARLSTTSRQQPL